MAASDKRPYDELAFYTLSHPDPAFIHQYVVDAYTAQTADERTKPIAVSFALIGLYLAVEKGLSGRQVQQAHMDLAKDKAAWPTFALPQERGIIRGEDVLAVPPGPERDAMILAWCASVWDAYADSQESVRQLTRERWGSHLLETDK